MMRNYVAGLLFLLVLVFNIFILKPEVISDGKHLKVPDVSFAYSGEEIYERFFNQLTPQAIVSHRTMINWDFVYPLVYTSFLILVSFIIFSNKKIRKLLVIGALIIFTLDYAENILQIYLLNELPEPHFGKGDRLGYLSSAKWIITILELSTLVIVGVANMIGHNK